VFAAHRGTEAIRAGTVGAGGLLAGLV